MKDLFANLRLSLISIWVSTPSFVEMCLADSSFNQELLPDLKLMLFCGETLGNHCVKKLYERFSGIKVINTYGPTEATVAVTALYVDREMCENVAPLPVGFVKEDCTITIIDAQGNPLGENTKGEIVISGASVSSGYYRNNEMTEKVFSRSILNHSEIRSYRTGDEGYLQSGLLFYCGRIDNQVKLNGFRIELEDIETNLRKIAAIEKAVVLPIKKEDKIQYLAAIVVLSQTVNDDEFQLGLKIKAELKNYLPEYMIPRKIIFRASLPITLNGKIDRASLLGEIK